MTNSNGGGGEERKRPFRLRPLRHTPAIPATPQLRPSNGRKCDRTLQSELASDHRVHQS